MFAEADTTKNKQMRVYKLLGCGLLNLRFGILRM